MEKDLKTQEEAHTQYLWNAKEYKELHSCDAEYWHIYMSREEHTFHVQSKISALCRSLSPGTLCYLIFAQDQTPWVRKESGSMVTVIRRRTDHESTQNCFDVLSPSGEIMVHVKDLMKIQLDKNKPRICHWNLDEGYLF